MIFNFSPLKFKQSPKSYTSSEMNTCVTFSIEIMSCSGTSIWCSWFLFSFFRKNDRVVTCFLTESFHNELNSLEENLKFAFRIVSPRDMTPKTNWKNHIDICTNDVCPIFCCGFTKIHVAFFGIAQKRK